MSRWRRCGQFLAENVAKPAPIKKAARGGHLILEGLLLDGRSRVAAFGWWSQAGSNRRPLACHASALPAELWPRNLLSPRRVEADSLTKPEDQVSSSFSMPSPMISVTSSSPSSSSWMKVESSSAGSSSTSISSSTASGESAFLPVASASASSSETNTAPSASAVSSSGSAAASGLCFRHGRGKQRSERSAQPRRYRARSPDSCSGHKTCGPSPGQTRLVPSSGFATFGGSSKRLFEMSG